MLLALPNVDVAFVVDQDDRTAMSAAAMFRVPWHPVGELEPRLADIDVCLVAIPLGVRAPYLELLASRGIAALVEKPFAVDGAEHARLVQSFGAHRLGVCLQRRFYASTKLLASILSSRPFGPLRSIEVRVGGFDLVSGGPGRYLTDPRLAGGGVVRELAVHDLDRALYATSATDATIVTVEAITQGGIDYDVILHGGLVTPAGDVDLRAEMTRLRPLDAGIDLQFERARVHLCPAPDEPLHVDGALELALGDGARTSLDAFALMWRAFLHGIERSECTPVCAETSQRTTRLLEDIYRRLPA